MRERVVRVSTRTAGIGFHFQEPWFVVLPDEEASNSVVLSLGKIVDCLKTIRYPSGRILMVGCWTDTQVTIERTRDAVAVVFGDHVGFVGGTLNAAARRASTASQLCSSITSILRGSAHVVASVDGNTTVRGSATGLRRVYLTRYENLPVVSNRAVVAATLVNSEISTARIATRLLGPVPPWPLLWQPVWERLVGVPPNCRVEVPRNGKARVQQWWSAPQQDRDFAEVADTLRSELRAAMALRVAPGDRIVSHLSGLDSTSLCSLATEQEADVVALTYAQPDPMDDDVDWAQRTASALRASGRRITHRVIPAAEVPLVYDDILAPRQGRDEPFALLHNRKRFEHILDVGERHSPRLHLMGLGGDELFSAGDSWLRSLARQHPALAMSKIRLLARSNHRSSYGGIVKSVFEHKSYSEWLRQRADDILTGASRVHSRPTVGWGDIPYVPSWITPHAREMIHHELVDACTDSMSFLSNEPGLQEMLGSIYAGAAATQGFEHIGHERGAVLAAPFFDDHVMNAVLSLSIRHRVQPARYKPLLVDAMRKIAPASTLERATKSETAATAVMGAAAHRDQIAGLAAGSHLVDRGLVNEGELLKACHGALDLMNQSRRLESTISCEMWLRENA